MNKNRMNKIMLVGLLVVAMFLTACNSPGRTLGTMWVVHNRTTAVVTEMGSGPNPTLSLPELREFQSYQIPVKEGLDKATEDFVNGNEADVRRTLEYLDPLLMRMLEIAEEED